MKRRRGIFAVIALVVIGFTIFIVRPIYRIRSFDSAHARIIRGENEAAVLRLMGSQQRIENKVSVDFWDDATLGDDVAKRVVKQYWYVVNLPPVPICWTVGFDSDGRVISKHRWD